MKKKLYLVETVGVGKYYVVAETLDQAEKKVLEPIEKENYGFSHERVLKSVTLIAEEGVICKQSWHHGPEGLVL